MFIYAHADAQLASKRLVVLDLKTSVFDTLDAVDIDTTQSQDTSSPFDIDGVQSLAMLPLVKPDTFLLDGTIFSQQYAASTHFDISDYPLSTIAKLFSIRSNQRTDLCTGTMVGDRYLLSSAHCVFAPYTSDVVADSIEVLLGYDGSVSEREVSLSMVRKIYFLEDWNISKGEDIAIMELEEPIGSASGWVSIAYQENSEFYKNNVFHKFSYPSFTTPFNDYPFTGDTLYYSYGPLDFISPHYIGILGHLNGAGGESGSSLLFQDLERGVAAYGVLTWLGNYSHSKFTRDRFYAFADIINTEIISSNNERPEDNLENFVIYPNPVSDVLYLKSKERMDKGSMVEIYDRSGRLILSQMLDDYTAKLNTGSLDTGLHILVVRARHKALYSSSFIKY